MYRKWSTAVLLALLMPVAAWAQNTGKLTGRVTDAATGEGLPGANVIILGTQIGTATDIDGNYTILGVPVGRYDIQGSFVGFTPQTFEGVDINSGYTRELNFELSEGQVLQDIVVEYERPLIQKDAIGSPRVATGEDIQNLPVRGVESVAAIQGGVVSTEGSNTLNIRGGRGGEVTYYIDGVKVVGTNVIPQAAIQEQEMLIGNISARYGDAMSGVISVTTKSGATKFFGSVEGITSEALDSFGYNLLSGTIGGPVMGSKLGFFLAGEFTDLGDSDPRAVGQLRVRDDVLADIRNAPQAFAFRDTLGATQYVPIPAGSIPNGTSFPIDAGGHFTIREGAILGYYTNAQGVQDSVLFALPGNIDPDGLVSRSLVQRAELLTRQDFTTESAKLSNGSNTIALSGNTTFAPSASTRFRIGGRYRGSEFESLGSQTRDVLFAPESFNTIERKEYQAYGTWTQNLSDRTFFQVQADYSRYWGEDYDRRFGKDFEDFFRYGDIDDPAFLPLRGYYNTNASGNLVFSNTYRDGVGPGSEVLGGAVTPAGGRFGGYSKFDRNQIRFTANATTQLGINQIEFGGEYEQQTSRAFSISAASLARLVDDGNIERRVTLPVRDAQGNVIRNDTIAITNYNSIPAVEINRYTSAYGYDVYGRNKVDSEDIARFVDNDELKDAGDYNVAPYQPIYYAGYIQDKIEFRDIVLNLGLRVDVFDNNTLVLKDQFARRPIVRAADLTAGGTNGVDGVNVPGNIGSDYAVYFAGSNIVGYRDLNGQYYAPNGNPSSASNVLDAGGQPRALKDANGVAIQTILPRMFEDYKPQVTVMPRLGVSFPVTDRALFFARYGIVSQRPSGNNFASLASLAGTGRINNNGLKPEQTTEYEVGFRQRVGDRQAFTVSGFFRQIDNLISLRDIRGAFPSNYSTYLNADFGTVKGLELNYDLRRTQGMQLNANYTLSFAQGTGSASGTTGTIVWVSETPPNFISPLDFDQRHRFNVSADYRLGSNEGPEILGANLLENLGVNVLVSGGSGTPYTRYTEPSDLRVSRAGNPTGGINEGRLPSYVRVDLRVDRGFKLGAANLNAFLWVQNLFDNDRVQGVYAATGLAGDSGFLSTPEGQAFAAQRETNAIYYQQREQSPFAYGIPRLTRIGLRLDF